MSGVLFPAGGAAGALALALLLGARHALDPDHLAAVSQIVLGDRRDGLRRSGIVGLWWGLGHALTLCLLGLPVVLYGRSLPEPLRLTAEAAVGVLLVVLGLRVWVRWRDGELGPRPVRAPGHAHEVRASHHAHEVRASHHAHEGRTPLTAFGVGLVHGVGGSAGVGVLAVASVTGPAALATLLLFSAATAASMGGSALALGYLVTREPVGARFHRLVPLLALAGAAFGVWYTASVLLDAVGV